MFVPKKNVSKVLRDITPGTGEIKVCMSPEPVATREVIRRITERSAPQRMKKPFPQIWYRALGIAFTLLFSGVGIYVGMLYHFKHQALDSFGRIGAEVGNSVHALMALDSGGATRSLKDAYHEFGSIERTGDRYHLWDIGNILGSFSVSLKTALSSLQGIDDVLLTSVSVSEHLDFLKKNGLSLFMSNKGGAVLLLLKQLSKDMGTLDLRSEKLAHATQALGLMERVMNTNDYLALKMKMYEAQSFLGALLGLLRRPNDAHLLVFFENPSEMRATGGFIGSYAVLTVHEGGLANIEVRDIYDSDGQLDLNAVPPIPLQAITTKWGARDANWFFDYPTSAQKLIYFLEHSKIYSERGITFDGAIAISADAVARMVGVTGDLSLPVYHMTLNEQNFLMEIQREVRSGQGRDKGEPKQVLKDVAPVLLEKLKGVNESGFNELVSRILEQIRYKNILAYFKDGVLEDAVVKAGASGAVYQASRGANGDYLAVADTNIAGGKTDIFMDQHVVLKSAIDLEGRAKNELTITRIHNGAKQKESWYHNDNQNYVRVYAPQNTKLTALSGETKKTIYPPINYGSSGYEVDSDVALEEGSGEARGKAVFGAWLTTPPGGTKQLTLLYEVPHALVLTDGQVYEFVFERQAGVRGSFEYEVQAPVGFRWRESKSMLYSYASDNPEGRVKIALTLEKV